MRSTSKPSMKRIVGGIFNLLTYNNGFFKSAKQRDYILSYCSEDNTLTSSIKIGKSIRHNTYVFDEYGIVTVMRKISDDETVLEWQRPSYITNLTQYKKIHQEQPTCQDTDENVSLVLLL